MVWPEEHTDGHSVRRLPRKVWQSDPEDWKHQNKSEESSDDEACSKEMTSKVIKDTHAAKKDNMDMMLSECLNPANEMSRHGGFAQA